MSSSYREVYGCWRADPAIDYSRRQPNRLCSTEDLLIEFDAPSRRRRGARVHSATNAENEKPGHDVRAHFSWNVGECSIS
jgi:hypothetical protein